MTKAIASASMLALFTLVTASAAPVPATAAELDLSAFEAPAADGSFLPLPRLSVKAAEYYAAHPDAWKAFVDGLPRRVSRPDVSVRPFASPWTPVVPSVAPKSLGAPILLTDGTVMLHENSTSTWYRLTPDKFGSYIKGTYKVAGSLPSGYAPKFFASAVLPDGRLIISGGEYNNGKAVWTTLGAMYNPPSDKWSSVSPPSGWSTIGDAQSVVLSNGTYMLANCCSNPPTAALLNVSNMSWSATGTGKADRYDEEGWSLLPDATVLTVDTYTTTVNGAACGKNTELYDPSTGKWSSAGNATVQLADCTVAGSVKPNFEVGPQVLRPDGTVVAFSGRTKDGPATLSIFNTTTKTWGNGPTMPTIGGKQYTNPDTGAVMLPNGHILFAASPGYYATPLHFFDLSPTNVITQVADTFDSATQKASHVNFVLLPSGQALMTDDSGLVWFYTPSGSPNSTWRPLVTYVPTTLFKGTANLILGRQLFGLSDGAGQGDDAQANTNFPLVRITNKATGHVFYCKTYFFGLMQPKPNQLSSTKFVMPANIETGDSWLNVVTNGIASPAWTVTVSN